MRPLAREKAMVDRLWRMHAALSEDLCALRQCLENAGVVSRTDFEVELHRQRFATVKNASGWSPSAQFGDTFNGNLHTALSSHIDKAAILALRALSQDIEASMRGGEERLFVFGGRTDAIHSAEYVTNTGECINSRCDTWQALQDMPYKRTASATVAAGGRLWICGGWGGMAPLNAVFCFSAKRDRKGRVGTWQSSTSMHESRSYGAAAVIAGYVYICGGTGDGPDLNAKASMERYDTRQGSRGNWEMLHPMGQKRHDHAMGVALGKIIVAGGSTVGGHGIATAYALGCAEVFDPAIQTWTCIPSMLETRLSAACAAMDKCFYVFGGWTAGRLTSSVERFDLEAYLWTTMEAMAVPRCEARAVVMSHKIYVCGGLCPAQTENVELVASASVDRFDPMTGSWKAVAPMILPRCDHVAAVLTAN